MIGSASTQGLAYPKPGKRKPVRDGARTPGLAIPKPGKRIRVRDEDASLVKIHSQYSRLKDAGRFGRVKCFTCTMVMDWKTEAHEGHFIQRGKLPTKFLDMNTHAQCHECNVVKRGNLVKYANALDGRYGAGTASMLVKMARMNLRPTRADYQKQVAHYQGRVKWLKKKLEID